MRSLVAKSLRLKLFLLFALLLMGFSSVHLLIRSYWTLPQLVALEVESDKRDIKKLDSAFSRIKSDMKRLVYDNAVWDEMVRVIEQQDIAFLKENYYIPESLTSLKLNGLHFYDLQGNEVSRYMLDNSGLEISNSIFINAPDSLKSLFLINANSSDTDNEAIKYKSGLVSDNGQIVLFVSGGIEPSSGNGPVSGTMLVWTYLDSKVSIQLSELMQKDISLLHIDSLVPNTQPIPFERYAEFSNIRTVDQNIYISFNDIFEQPLLVMSYLKPKRMFDDKLIEDSMGIALLSSIFILGFIYYLINRVLIIPLTSLRDTVVKVIDQGNYSQTTNIKRQDEIGRLANLIDGLFETVDAQQNILVEANNKLQKLSDTDELTKIANRRALMHFLKLIERDREEALFPVSLIMLDIDHFKTYNDYYGHQAGDTVICQVAEVLSANTRSSMDLVARYGGEEFTILLTQISEDEALLVANKLKQAIVDLKIPHEKSTTADCVSASVGLTTCALPNEYDIEQLFRVADTALYAAKDIGRNSVNYMHYQSLKR